MKCGTCCTAPDISTLRKPLGVKCPHLDADGLCGIYATRPSICQSYRPDEICLQVSAPTLAERVTNYVQLFGLEDETQCGQR
ncbi:MAG TPA: YkgJ family cysteine cluster protein [Geomobilimonas sp.]|nr:YkgJ family cysteine cluster protein [Geomobilimonas sp.]